MRLSTLAKFGSLGALTLSFACGGSSQPPPLVAPPSSAGTPVQAQPDLSPVAEPKNLIAIGRWKNPTATEATLEKLTGFPAANLQHILAEEVADSAMANVLKMDASFDLALALDPASKETSPEVLMAFSLPLTSLDEARAHAQQSGQQPSPMRPGVYKLRKRQGSWVCDLALSLGEAPARLVCGQHDRDLEALLPWMTRGMPTINVGKGDVHVEVRLGHVPERLRDLIQNQGKTLSSLASIALSHELGLRDQAILDVFGSVITEGLSYVNDVDTIAVEGTLGPQGTQATFDAAVHYRSSNSWLVHVLTQRNDRAGAPPPIFWQAPKDSDRAFYGRGVDPLLYEGVRKGVGTLLSEELDAIAQSVGQKNASDADRKAVEKLIADSPLLDTTSVSASGSTEAPKDTKTGAASSAADALRESREAMASMVGWHVVGIDAPSASIVAWLRELSAVYNRPGIQAILKKVGWKDFYQTALPTLRMGATPAGLPAQSTMMDLALTLDSKAIEMLAGRDPSLEKASSTPKKTLATKGVFHGFFVVMPDGANRTWIGFGADQEAIKTHLLVAKTGAPKEGTLAAREGLDLLKSSTAVGAGFFSLESLVHKGMRGLSKNASAHEIPDLSSALGALPDKGTTPIVLTWSGASGATPSNALEAQLQKSTLDDIAFLLKAAVFASAKGRAPLLKLPRLGFLDA